MNFVESLQSHMILTMSHWSSGLTCLLPATRVTGSNPQGGTYVEPDSPVSVVSLQFGIKRLITANEVQNKRYRYCKKN